MARPEPRARYDKYGSEPFFPNHVIRQSIQFVLLFALLILLSSLWPAPMLPKADPFDTPEYVKPACDSLCALPYLAEL